MVDRRQVMKGGRRARRRRRRRHHQADARAMPRRSTPPRSGSTPSSSPSTLSKDEQMAEMEWFIDAAKPFAGMKRQLRVRDR